LFLSLDSGNGGMDSLGAWVDAPGLVQLAERLVVLTVAGESRSQADTERNPMRQKTGRGPELLSAASIVAPEEAEPGEVERQLVG